MKIHVRISGVLFAPLCFLAALSFIGCFSSSAIACSVCGCGDPLMAAGDSMPLAGRLSLGLDAEFLQAKAKSDDDPDRTESLIQQVIRPLLVYSPTDNLNLVLQIPIVNKSWRLSATNSEGAKGLNQWGPGDIDLGARIFLVQATDIKAQSRQSVSVSLGSSFNSGNNSAEVISGDGRVERVDEHAQLGTGALGPYLGLLYAFHEDPWNLSLNIYDRAHSTNSYGYTFGNAVLAGLSLQYKWSDDFVLGLAGEGRYASKDDSSGMAQDNSGGSVVDVSPGFQLRVLGAFWIGVKVQIPAYTNFNGNQTLSPTTLASMKYDLF